jgi:hypothetical protein
MGHEVGVDCVFRCLRCGCMRADLDDGSVEAAKDRRISELEKKVDQLEGELHREVRAQDPFGI